MTVSIDVYPSRVDAQPTIIPRQDPVVYTDSAPTDFITPSQVADYANNGFVSISQVFSEAEVAVLRRELDRLVDHPAIRDSEEAITEKGSGIVRSIFRVHRLSRVFEALSRDERLVRIAEHLLGDSVYIHQSRVNMKPGFHGKEFYWHSDFETWHMEDGMPRMRAVSCSIALTDNNEFNGPLMLIPGSHQHFIACVGQTPDDHYKESLKKQEYGVPDPESLRFLSDQGGLVAPKGKAGSVTFFECNTMHGSNSNISPFPRSNAFFVYNALSNRLVDPFCGLRPRPPFIAEREPEAIEATRPNYQALSR